MLSDRLACALAESITTLLQAPNQQQCGAAALDNCMHFGGNTDSRDAQLVCSSA